jgi:pyridoxal phosphate enzyme (YggS family)
VITENIQHIISSIPSNVQLVAVSKTKPNEDIIEAYNFGQRVFGENKVQELVAKYESLPKDIQWHFIGHLQTNKVKYIAPFVSLIHSVDSLKLLQIINKEAEKCGRTISCLLQVYIAKEETKYGLDQTELNQLLEESANLKNVIICGFMGMATNTDDMNTVRKEFKELKNIFEATKNKNFAHSNFFNTLSMGMSGDYKIAIEEGSTMIRMGSTIFGERFYH